MKKPLLYLISALTIALTGCVSNAARYYKNDKEVQSSITNQIVAKRKETYYIELEPDIDNTANNSKILYAKQISI